MSRELMVYGFGTYGIKTRAERSQVKSSDAAYPTLTPALEGQRQAVAWPEIFKWVFIIMTSQRFSSYRAAAFP